MAVAFPYLQQSSILLSQMGQCERMWLLFFFFSSGVSARLLPLALKGKMFTWEIMFFLLTMPIQSGDLSREPCDTVKVRKQRRRDITSVSVCFRDPSTHTMFIHVFLITVAQRVKMCCDEAYLKWRFKSDCTVHIINESQCSPWFVLVWLRTFIVKHKHAPVVW